MDGDLISRKAMMEVIDERERTARKYVPDIQYDELRPTLQSIREFVNNMPAVDAEPVRHGTWEMRHKTIKTGFATLSGTYPTCNLCGHAEFGMYKSTPYCPNCGAKMDGEDDK